MPGACTLAQTSCPAHSQDPRYQYKIPLTYLCKPLGHPSFLTHLWQGLQKGRIPAAPCSECQEAQPSPLTPPAQHWDAAGPACTCRWALASLLSREAPSLPPYLTAELLPSRISLLPTPIPSRWVFHTGNGQSCFALVSRQTRNQWMGLSR